MTLHLVGKISHYYDKIGVAVVDVVDLIKKGDTIKISGHDKEFSQKVDSMQVEHESVEQAKKGDTVGMKMDQKVKAGDKVYLK